MSPQVWFISGANRGIGYGLAQLVASQGNIVFAGARTPSKATALQKLAASNPNVHVVKLESTSASDVAAAAKTVESTTGGVDVVVANAGIASNWQKAVDASVDALYEHLRVNTVGPLILFQALYPLLLKRETRKFIVVSTLAGSFEVANALPVPLTVYGSSKAAVNFITESIHKEHKEEGFTVFPVHPGMVDTDMGATAKDTFGESWQPITTEQSAEGLFKVIDGATKEQSGKFLSYDGSELPF
jgi:norsolorinic acid ketoreductase